jgi:hypothetical protein
MNCGRYRVFRCFLHLLFLQCCQNVMVYLVISRECIILMNGLGIKLVFIGYVFIWFKQYV